MTAHGVSHCIHYNIWGKKKKKKVDILGSQKMCPSLTIYELRKENLFVPQETRIYLWREAQSANR